MEEVQDPKDGSLVIHKAGGPVMGFLVDGQFNCHWFVGGEFRQAKVPPIFLRPPTDDEISRSRRAAEAFTPDAYSSTPDVLTAEGPNDTD